MIAASLFLPIKWIKPEHLVELSAWIMQAISYSASSASVLSKHTSADCLRSWNMEITPSKREINWLLHTI